MAITLTSDPIVGIADVKELIGVTNDTEARLLINSVSEKFLRYTHRRRITSGSVTEWSKGGCEKIYLHGMPVDEDSAFTISVYGSDGSVSTTMTLADNDFRVVQSPTDAYVELITYTPPWVEGIENVKLAYTGGWATVPGDIVMAAIQQMRVENNRRDGELGAMSVSANGQTVQFETSGLIKAVEDAWNPYRMLI